MVLAFLSFSRYVHITLFVSYRQLCASSLDLRSQIMKARTSLQTLNRKDENNLSYAKRHWHSVDYNRDLTSRNGLDDKTRISPRG